MTEINLTRLSKFVSTILRHRAGDFGIELDEHGFTDYARLREIVQSKSHDQYTNAHWDAIVEVGADGKHRFEVVDGRIRARYGHSRVSPIVYDPITPPAILYHGTNPQAAKIIRREGLRSMKRQYVHLSANTERATSVARRRTESEVLLVIRATEAHLAGVEFYCPEPEHYLAKSIPPIYIEFPEA